MSARSTLLHIYTPFFPSRDDRRCEKLAGLLRPDLTVGCVLCGYSGRWRSNPVFLRRRSTLGSSMHGSGVGSVVLARAWLNPRREETVAVTGGMGQMQARAQQVICTRLACEEAMGFGRMSVETGGVSCSGESRRKRRRW